MTTQQERDVCTAPKGLVRLVQVDPRDSDLIPQGEPMTLAQAREALYEMPRGQQEVTRVYDDHANIVSL